MKRSSTGIELGDWPAGLVVPTDSVKEIEEKNAHLAYFSDAVLGYRPNRQALNRARKQP